MELGIFIP